MADYRRHVAKIANTDQRCIVAMLQIPNREDHALVIPTDALPPRMSQAVQDLLESAEGQGEEMFANVLARRMFRDEPNTTVLQSLHNHKYLMAVPVEQVIMFPAPNMPFALIDILRNMGKYDAHKLPTADELAAKNKFNHHAHNMASMSEEQRLSMARGILLDAELLEQDVMAKKEKAYQMAPELRPGVVKFIDEPHLDEGSVKVDALPVSIVKTKANSETDDLVQMYMNNI